MYSNNDYVRRYSSSRRSFSKGFISILIIIAVIIGIFTFVGYNSEKNYTITLTRVTVKNYDRDSKYLVFGDNENGENMVFEIEDAWFRLRFNSSDLFGKLKEGKSYEIKTIGWRVPLFSWYENIIEAKEIK